MEKQLEGELRKKHHAETLHGVETELTPLAKEIGINPEGKKWNEILKEIKTKASSLRRRLSPHSWPLSSVGFRNGFGYLTPVLAPER